jgi:tryptophan 2,3-dioxygenase
MAERAEPAALTYGRYLALDQVLGAQQPRSDEHDEMLFIVVHQVYELWFKQLLHELAHLQASLEAGDTPPVLATLKRCLTILKVTVAQIDVLETITPLQFAGFRSRLEAASGFQSAQFRELEAVLGLRNPAALEQYGATTPEWRKIATAMGRPSVFDSFLRYLAAVGFMVPESVLARDVTRPPEPSEVVQEVLLQVYRQQGQPAEVAERLVDMDEGIQEWRYRHLKMVERTIGPKPGTGGSPGAAYLATTLGRPLFPDLWAVRSEL